jgi:hypothetical protein
VKFNSIDFQKFLISQRGNFYGSVVAGFLFVGLSPRTEFPEVFLGFGLPLIIAGTVLSAVSFAIRKN